MSIFGFKITSHILRTAFASALTLLFGCGTAGEPDASSSFGEGITVLGSISGQGGSQAEMQGWVIVLVDKESLSCRVAEVDAAGLFALPRVDTSGTYTLVLISPTYVVSSVLSHPALNAGTVLQYFKVTGTNLPRLIHKGPIITLESEQGVSFEEDLALDSDGDSIPDGIETVIGTALSGGNSLIPNSITPSSLTPSSFERSLNESALTTLLATDLDNDGIPNIEDPDLDGDGLVNIFDSEDDGDQTLDVFDLDSDGDAIVDSTQTVHDLYFPVGVEWVSVKYETIPTSSSATSSTLTFYAKLRQASEMPLSVSIRGAPYLLSNATVNELSPDDEEISVAWNSMLSDDGKSEDAGAGDLLFAKKVIIEGTKKPTDHQVVFFSLEYGTGADQWFLEFPYTFSPITPATITASYSALSRIVTLSGNPYGDVQDFIWTASVYNSDGKKVYTSEQTLGTTRTVTLPESVIEGDQTYTYKVTAQVVDRVPGYVGYTIESLSQTLE